MNVEIIDEVMDDKNNLGEYEYFITRDDIRIQLTSVTLEQTSWCI